MKALNYIFIYLNRLFLILMLMGYIHCTAQKSLELAQYNFEFRVELSQQILKNQPSKDSLIKMLPPGYIMALPPTATEYYIQCKDNTVLTCKKHVETKKIVSVAFTEKVSKEELYKFTEREMGFKMGDSEHMCDYFIKENTSIRFCPGSNENILVVLEEMEQ